MKQTVLIITSKSEQTAAWRDRERYIKEFCSQVEALLVDVEVIYTTYNDIDISIVGGYSAIYDTCNDLDLKEVAFVHFKNWQYEPNEAPVIAQYLKVHGIHYDNSEVGWTVSQGKLGQMMSLVSNGIPVPDTFFARRERLHQLFTVDKLPKGFTFPLIMKADDGSRGDDNHLVRSAQEALGVLADSKPDMQYVLQNFIPNNGDYRFLYVGLEDQPMVFHRKAVEGSHLNNTSKGGSGSLVDVASISPKHLEYARRSAELLGREIGGVDILIHSETGQPYVLEVNGTPALATGYSVEEKAQRMADYIAKMLEVQEEE